MKSNNDLDDFDWRTVTSNRCFHVKLGRFKHRYDSKEAALGENKNAYICKDCGFWHGTSK